MDAVILAAGNGSRLKGIAATGMKPLLVRDGEALVGRLCRQVAPYVSRIVLVVSPVNAAAIVDLLGPEYTYVIQPEADGPGGALLRGLEAVTSDRVLVLMGDNFMHDDDVQAVANTGTFTDLVIGTRTLEHAHVAQRFTRVRMGGSGYIESEEGPIFGWDGPWEVWCGPFRTDTKMCRKALKKASYEGDELKIGPWLGSMGTIGKLVTVDVVDIGVPEELK
jgi:NDP-sugar pyrophosphorylase family protein